MDMSLNIRLANWVKGGHGKYTTVFVFKTICYAFMHASSTKNSSEIKPTPYRAAVIHTGIKAPKSAASVTKELNAKSGTIRATSLRNVKPMPAMIRAQLTAVKTSGSFRRKPATIGYLFCNLINSDHADFPNYSPHHLHVGPRNITR